MLHNIEIHVTGQSQKGEQLLRKSKKANNVLLIEVTIPIDQIGVDERLTLPDNLEANLFRGKPRRGKPFLLKIYVRNEEHGVENKDLIHLQCSVNDQRKCVVTVNKLKASKLPLVHIASDEVSFPKNIRIGSILSVAAASAIRVQAGIICPRISFSSPKGTVLITTEGILRTTEFVSIAKKTYVEGQICHQENSRTELVARTSLQNAKPHSTTPEQTSVLASSEKDRLITREIPYSCLDVTVNGDLHIGTDGKIGSERVHNSKEHNVVTQLKLIVTGNIHNFGKIVAALILNIKAKSILTGRQCKDDTVQRYFDRIEEKLGLANIETQLECQPTTSSLLNAVNTCQLPLIPELLRTGVDPNAPTGKGGSYVTSIACKKLSDNFMTDNYGRYSNNREGPDAAASLLKAWERRSGTMIASSITCEMSGDIQDCGQLKGNAVHFKVEGDLIVEEDSIWTSGVVSGTCSGNLLVNGTVKLERFESLEICSEFTISEIGKVLTAKGGEVNVGGRFHNLNRMLNAREQLNITTNVFEQSANALLASKAKLKLTVQGDSSHCEGEIYGRCVLLKIAGNVEFKCDVNAIDLCVIEIAEGRCTKIRGHFLNKGVITVKNGELVAVQKLSATVSDTADITLEGEVISNGIRASSIHIRTIEGSKISIHPNQNVALEIPSVSCLTGSLTTEHGSLLHLLTDTENSDVIFRCCEKWIHYGELELIKSEAVDGPYETSGYFELSQASILGKIENCDNIRLLVLEQFENYTNLSARTEVSIAGKGEICNKSGGSINCTAGPIKLDSIGSLTNQANSYMRCKSFQARTLSAALSPNKNRGKQKFDFQNQGIIIGEDKVVINAENINNADGTIRSCRGNIHLIWSTDRQKKVEITGVVQSHKDVTFDVKEAEYFICECIGGNDEQTSSFVLPCGGLFIRCSNSNIIFKTPIYGDADVKVVSKWNLQIFEDMHVRDLLVEVCGKVPKNENVSGSRTESVEHVDNTTEANGENELEKVQNIYARSTLKHDFEEIREQVAEDKRQEMPEIEELLEPTSDTSFYAFVGKASSVTCRKMSFTSDCNTHITVLTSKGSQVFCEKAFYAGSDVVFDCRLQLSHGSSMMANSIEFAKDAVVCLAQTGADVEANVFIGFVNSFEHYGTVFNKDQVQCNLNVCCMEEEVKTEKNNLSTSSNGCLKRAHFLLAGKTVISGYLQLLNIDEVKIASEAKLCCDGFHIPKSDNNTITSLRIESGCLEVHGPCTCFLKGFIIQEHGAFRQFGDQDDHECQIEVSNSAELAGRIESSLKGRCLLRCEESLTCTALKADLNCKSYQIVALKSVFVDSDSRVFVKKGHLCITNANDDETLEVNGDIKICGKLIGQTSTEFDGGSSKQSSLEIEGRKVFFEGANITGFNKTELFAAEYMMIDTATVLIDGDTIEIDIASLELKGEIKNYETLHLKTRTMLVTGKIHKCSKITIEAEYAAVNCGEIHGRHTGIVAPIYLNCPKFPDGDVCSSIDSVPQLGNDEQKELIVEGLLCIIVGSHLQGTNINIKSVLRFDFASKTSTVPSSRDLDNWKNVVNSSLSKMNTNISPTDIQKLVEQAANIPKVVCNLGVASHLCNDIVQMSQNIQNGGLDNFNIENLVGTLIKAHSEYSKISSFNLQLNIRPKLRKLKDTTARLARSLMNKCFGPSSFGNRRTFKDDSEIEEGIEATSYIFKGESTDVLTKGNFIADSLTFNGGKGSWKNQGHLEACGDIFISAKTVYQKGSRVAQAIAGGSILLEADNVEAENLKANKLKVKGVHSANLKSAEVSEEAIINSDDFVIIDDMKAKDVHVHAKESVSVKSVSATNDVNITGGDIAVDQLNAKNLQTDATKSTTLESVSLTGQATVQGKGRIEVSDMKSDDIYIRGESSVDIKNASVKNDVAVKSSGDVIADSVDTNNMVIDAKEGVNIGNITAKGSIHAKSSEGRISLDSKIKANLVRLEADMVSLTGKTGEAHHQLKTLSVKTKQIQNIESLLNQSGVYEDMQISDQLDLAVEDQSVVLANIRKLDFDLCLRAASIDVESNIESSHDVQLQATKRDINLHEGSSVKSTKKVYMESEKGSVNVVAAQVHGEECVTMNAKNDVNIVASGGNSTARKSTVTSGSGGAESDDSAITIKAGSDIKIHASDVKSKGTNQFIAGRDIKITAHTYQTIQRRKKSSWGGLKTETITTTSTHVDKSNVKGKSNVFKAGGEFTSIAGNIQSEDGNVIHAKGKVSLKDIMTTTTVKTSTNVLGGLLYSRDEKETSESSHGTLVEDTSSLANTKVISDTSNIEWTGSSIQTPGNFIEIAHKGKIIHSRRILTKTYQVTECGFFFSKPTDERGVGVVYKFQHTDGISQSTSDDSVHVGGNYSLEAKEFESLNSFSLNVGGDMTVDARKVTFAGAKLKSLENSGGFDIGTSDTSLTIGVNFAHQHGTQQQSQSLYTGGTLRMVNVEDATFENSVTDVGAMEGDIKNLNVISKTDDACKVEAGLGIGFDLATRTPTLSVNVRTGISQVVKNQASLNIRSGSNGLSVKTLTLTGAAVTFDGDVHDFAENIVSHDVHEIENEFGLGFDVSKKVATGKSSKKLSVAMQHYQGRLRSCVTSANGQVHQSLKRKVNTDMDKCRVTDEKFGFAMSHEFKGSLSKNAAAIGKSIAKSAGKEILKACGSKLVSELGLPEDIANAIIQIASGDAPLQETLLFLANKACVPKDLVEAIGDLLLKNDHTKLLIWICSKAGFDHGIIAFIFDVVQKGKFERESFLRIAKHVGKLLGLSGDILTLTEQLVTDKQNRVSTIQSVSVGLLKSPEGQRITKKLCSVLGLSDNITHLIVEFFKQTKSAEKGVIVIQAVGMMLNMPMLLLEGIKEVILRHEFKSLLIWFGKEIGIDQHIVSVVVDNLRYKKSNGLKDILYETVRYFARNIGISDHVITEIEARLQGKQPKDGTTRFIFNIICDLSKSKHFLEVQELLWRKIETICKSMHIPSTFLKASSDLTRQIALGKTPTAALPIVLYLLESFDVSKEVRDGVKALLEKSDPCPLAKLLGVKLGLDPEIFTLLTKQVVDRKSLKQIVIIAVRYFCTKYKMPSKFVVEAVDAIDKDLHLCYRTLEDATSCDSGEILMHFAEKSKVKQLLEEHEHIVSDSNECQLFFKALSAFDGTEGSLVKFLCQLAAEMGISEALVTGISDFALREDPAGLAEWLGEKISLHPDLIVSLLRALPQKRITVIAPIVMKCVCVKAGISKTTAETIDKIFTKDLRDDAVKPLLVKIAVETITPKVKKLAADAGIPDDLVELLFSVVEIEKPMDVRKILSKLLEQLASMLNVPSDVVNQMSSIFSQIKNGQYKHAVVKLLLFFLQRSSMPIDIYNTIKGFLTNDIDPFARLLSTKFNIQEDQLLEVLRNIKNGAPFIAIIKGCIKIFSMKLELPLAVITDIELIFEGKAPEHTFKEFEEFIKDIDEVKSKDALLRKCEELNIPTIFVDCVETVFCQVTSTEKAVNLFTILAVKCGIADDFSAAVANVIFTKDTTKLFLWIEKEAGIKPVLSETVLEIVVSLEFDTATAKRLLKGVGLSLGLSVSTSDRAVSIFDNDMPRKETGILVKDIAIELTLPHISRAIENCVGIPSDLVKCILDILKLDTSFEQCCKLVEIIALQFGVPEDLVNAIYALVWDQNISLFAAWISYKIGIDGKLSMSVLDTIRSSESLPDAVKKLPICFFKYFGLSDEMIRKTEMLMDNKLPTSEIPKVLTLVTVELFRDKVDKDVVEIVLNVITTDGWFERTMHFVRYIAKTMSIPIACVDGVADLIRKKDPTKIAVFFADTTGIDQTVMVTLAKAVLQNKDPKHIMRSMAKAAGIPEEAVFVLEEVIKRNTSKPVKKGALTGSHSGKLGILK